MDEAEIRELRLVQQWATASSAWPSSAPRVPAPITSPPAASGDGPGNGSGRGLLPWSCSDCFAHMAA